MRKFRSVKLQVQVNGQPHEYTLRGVNDIDFSFDSPVGVTQGITRNFVHPWFLKTFTIKLQGSAYIGAFTALADDTETVLPTAPQTNADVKAQGQTTQVTEEKLTVPKKVWNYFKSIPEQLAKKVSKPKTSTGYYYRTQQFLKIMEDLSTISTAIQSGGINLVTIQGVKQTLLLGNYYDTEDKSLQFDGFIESLSVKENAKQLGILEYTMSFVGVLAQVAKGKVGETKAKDIWSLIEQLGSTKNKASTEMAKQQAE